MKKILVVVALLMAISASSYAAVTANAAVTVTVQASITATNTAGLALVNVIQGATKTITSGAAGAAAFSITGSPNALTGVAVTFPTTLIFGANAMAFTGDVPEIGRAHV